MTHKIMGAKRLAGFFFILGTILFILQLCWQELNIITAIGFYYVAISVLCNAFFVLVLIFGLFLKESIKDTFIAIGYISLNIPIALGYGHIIFTYVI